MEWIDVVEFFRKLEAQTAGVGYRLPTEAEWEYACRAGTSAAYSFGNNERQLPQYAWYRGNSNNRPHPAGEKRPNAWGLFDMHGNVYERCQDWHGAYESLQLVSDPAGPTSGTRRVLRGGAFLYRPQSVRAANRLSYLPDNFTPSRFGFLLARTIPLSP